MVYCSSLQKSAKMIYEPESLRTVMATLDRHLWEKGSTLSILKYREFDTSRKFLNGKVNELPKQGLGKKKHRADPLTEEELLWSQQVPGADTALNLNLTVFYLISQQFDTCRCPKTSSTEGRTQFLNSPCAGTTEYVERPTKTKQAGLRKVSRRITQRMFATSDLRCPVKYLERLISKRPQPHRNPAHFTFSPSPSPSLTDICYFIQPMGSNKIDGYMKKITTVGGLDITKKHFTNHSVWNTTVRKLQKAEVSNDKNYCNRWTQNWAKHQSLCGHWSRQSHQCIAIKAKTTAISANAQLWHVPHVPLLHSLGSTIAVSTLGAHVAHRRLILK